MRTLRAWFTGANQYATIKFASAKRKFYPISDQNWPSPMTVFSNLILDLSADVLSTNTKCFEIKYFKSPRTDESNLGVVLNFKSAE